MNWLSLWPAIGTGIARTTGIRRATNLSSLCQSTRICLASRGLSSGRWDEIVIRDQLDAFTREHVTRGGQG